MRIRETENGFTVWISRSETGFWARGDTTGKSWPCSMLAWNAIRAEFDANGLLDFSLNSGQKSTNDIPSDELNACVCDHIKGKLPESNPAYFIAVGQFTLKTFVDALKQNFG